MSYELTVPEEALMACARLDEIQSVYLAMQKEHENNRWKRMLVRLAAKRDMKQILTQHMHLFQEIANDSDGFDTDKEYDPQQLAGCIVTALTMGLAVDGHQFCIIGKKVYVRAAGFEARLDCNPHVESYEVEQKTLPTPIKECPDWHRITMKATYKLKGAEATEIEKRFVVRRNSGMGMEALIGKGKRKMLAYLDEVINKVKLPDGELDEFARPIEGNVIDVPTTTVNSQISNLGPVHEEEVPDDTPVKDFADIEPEPEKKPEPPPEAPKKIKAKTKARKKTEASKPPSEPPEIRESDDYTVTQESFIPEQEPESSQEEDDDPDGLKEFADMVPDDEDGPGDCDASKVDAQVESEPAPDPHPIDALSFDWTSCPRKKCQGMGYCMICKRVIAHGKDYYDGGKQNGKNWHAHVECVGRTNPEPNPKPEEETQAPEDTQEEFTGKKAVSDDVYKKLTEAAKPIQSRQDVMTFRKVAKAMLELLPQELVDQVAAKIEIPEGIPIEEWPITKWPKGMLQKTCKAVTAVVECREE